MAETGQAASHAPQSMHSSGWMYSIRSPSYMQSTGHCSTQLRSMTSTHACVTTYVIALLGFDASCPAREPVRRHAAERSAAKCGGGRDPVPQRRGDELKQHDRPGLGPGDAV